MLLPILITNLVSVVFNHGAEISGSEQQTDSGKLRHGPRLKNAFFLKNLMLFKDVSIKSNEIWSTESIQNSGYSVKRSRDLVT